MMADCIWIGPMRPIAVYGADKLVAPIDPAKHHLEPIRGMGFVLAVFDRDEWLNYAKHDVMFRPPHALGYTTVHALGVCNVDGSKVLSVKEWMVATNYRWEGP